MKLLIIPGAADPETTYREVYGLLRDEAAKRKFTKVIVRNYPGHFSYDKISTLSVMTAAAVIEEVCSELESDEEEYVVLCRSFGCLPFVHFLGASKDLIFMKKVVLWGVSPYYLWYKYFFKEFNPEIFQQKNVRVNPDLFSEIYPIELSLDEMEKNLGFKIILTSGEFDESYPKKFHEFLKRVNKNPQIAYRRMIKGEGHTITKPNKDYFDLIFS